MKGKLWILFLFLLSFFYSSTLLATEGISMSFDCKQFRGLVVQPALEDIGYWSQEAEDLLIGTAAVESRMGTYLHQIEGPALGPFQMEPATHEDIWENFLQYRPVLSAKVVGTNASGDVEALIYNLRYAAIMARIHYLRVPEEIPKKVYFGSKEDYITALGAYWKEHYNTYKGAGHVGHFKEAYYNCGCDT